MATTDGGQTWVVQNIPGNVHVWNIDCVNTSDCWLTNGLGGGGIYSTTDGGTTWTAQSSPGAMVAISCVDTSDCWAVGVGIDGTTDGGTTWTAETPPNSIELLSVSCISLSDCFASGGEPGIIDATMDGGNTWTEQVDDSSSSDSNFVRVKCINDTTDCWAVGGIEFDHTDGAPNTVGLRDPRWQYLDAYRGSSIGCTVPSGWHFLCK